jgi:hypothetical protein
LLCLNCLSQAYEECRYRVGRLWYP